MKNKILFFGSLCLILALGLVFVGCAQTVEFATLGAPGNVKASLASTVLTVTWDAVDGAYSYDVVASQDGKKTIFNIGYGSASPVVGSDGSIADLDKWEAKIQSSGFPKGTFKIGVVAESNRFDISPSSPGWASDTVAFP